MVPDSGSCRRNSELMANDKFTSGRPEVGSSGGGFKGPGRSVPISGHKETIESFWMMAP